MRSASYPYSSYTHRAPPRRRAIAFLLAVVTNGLIVLMLLRLAAFPPRATDVKTQLITLQLQKEPAEVPARTRAVTRKPSGGAPPRPPVPAPVPVPTAPAGPLQMVIVSRDVFAASDIAHFPKRQAGPPAEAGIAGSGGGSGGATGPGEGPGGERLYDADWYRKPTHAELATYLPAGVATGWGMIVCQTVAQYRVDNCRELGDWPQGSGLARAVRQAAWQFRVRPPRVGGHPIIGAWVRIKIDVTPEKTAAADGG
jgi:protein TonB